MLASPRRGRSSLVLLLLSAGLLHCGDDARRAGNEAGNDAVIPFPTCARLGVELGAVGTIEADAFDAAAAFALTQDTIVVQRRGTEGSNASYDLELVAYDPETLELRQITTNDTDDFLLDARGDALLYVATTDEGRELILERGDTRLVLDVSSLAAPLFEEQRPIRLLSDEAAGWLAYVETPQPGRFRAAVKLHLDGETWDLAPDMDGNQLPDVLGRTVVWAGHDGENWDIYTATIERGAIRRQTITRDDEIDRLPMLADDAIYWLAGGAVRRWDRTTGVDETLHEGPCVDLAVDADRAAFVCSGDADALDWWPATGNQVWYWDGSALRQVHRTDEAILEVALGFDHGEAALAWVAYDDLTLEQPFDWGLVYFMRPDTPNSSPVVLADIGSGCWYCDMLWPPVTLRLNGSFVAWNYALEEPQPSPRRPDAIGYARLGPSVVCQGE